MLIDDLVQENEALREQYARTYELSEEYGNTIIGLTKLCETLIRLLKNIPNEHISEAKDKVAMEDGDELLRGWNEGTDVPQDD